MSIKTILISQPRPESGKSPYYDIAARYGAEATFRAFIEVESVTPREFRNQKVNILDHTAIVFTSRKAMEHFFQLSEELRVTIPEDMKYFCINEQVANYLQKFIVYRKRKVFYPEAGGQAELVAIMQKHSKELYFLPMAEDHKNDLIDLLTSKKLQFTKAIMYRTVSKKFTAAEKKEKYDMIIFFSPAGVASLRTTATISRVRSSSGALAPPRARLLSRLVCAWISPLLPMVLPRWRWLSSSTSRRRTSRSLPRERSIR